MTRFSGRVPAALVAGLLVLGGLSVGCSKDKSSDGPAGPKTSRITVEQIIFNPKSPVPGDTLRATAVVTSDDPSAGSFVVYSWTASGGQFVENDRGSVRWVAPLQSAIYSLTVTATNNANTSQLTDDVFVGNRLPLIAERAGQLYPFPTGSDLYYTSAPGQPDGGLIIRLRNNSGDVAPFGETDEGFEFSFSKDRTLAAHRFVEPISSTSEKFTVVYDDLVTLDRATIARDPVAFPFRPGRFERPFVSSNGQFICYQGGMLDQSGPPSQGGVDTFAVFLYHFPSKTVHRATFKGFATRDSVSNSFNPSISSDNQNLVFVSDRTGAGVWEYYSLPIVGTTVTADTVPGALVKLSDTGGQMAKGSGLPPDAVRADWNPASTSVLAVIGADNKLRLVPAGGTGAILMAAPGNVIDFQWKADGQSLGALIAGDVAYQVLSVNLAGQFEEILAVGGGDRIGNISWSPDGELIVYALTRGADVWYEVFDVGGSTGVSEPVRISPAFTLGDAVDFGVTQSLRPAWAPGTRTVYLFFLDGATPRVESLDLSGLGGS